MGGLLKAALHFTPHRLLTQCLLLKSQQTSHQCTTLLLYFTLPSHTVPPPEITTDKSSVHHSTALLHTAISHSASSWNHNRQVISAPLYCSTSHCHLTQCLLLKPQQTSRQGTTLLLYFTLPSHTVPPDITTDKSSGHHSTALLYTAISHSASWDNNRQVFSTCILCSTTHHIMHTLHSMKHQWVHLHEQALVHTHTHTHTHTHDHDETTDHTSFMGILPQHQWATLSRRGRWGRGPWRQGQTAWPPDAAPWPSPAAPSPVLWTCQTRPAEDGTQQHIVKRLC